MQMIETRNNSNDNYNEANVKVSHIVVGSVTVPLYSILLFPSEFEGLIPIQTPFLSLQEANLGVFNNVKALYEKSYLSISNKLNFDYKIPQYKNDVFNNIKSSENIESEKLFEFLRKKLMYLKNRNNRMREYRVIGNDSEGQSIFLCRFINRQGTPLPECLNKYNKKEIHKTEYKGQN